jgi:hypothetical protein
MAVEDAVAVEPGSAPGSEPQPEGAPATDAGAGGSAPPAAAPSTPGSESAAEELIRERKIKQRQAAENMRLREENAFLRGQRSGVIQTPPTGPVQPEPEPVAPDPAKFEDGVSNPEYRKA